MGNTMKTWKALILCVIIKLMATPEASTEKGYVENYRDSSDGSVNGRIRLNIDPSQRYAEQGTWKFKVYGESVSGTED